MHFHRNARLGLAGRKELVLAIAVLATTTLLYVQNVSTWWPS